MAGTVPETELFDEAMNLFKDDPAIWMGSHTYCVVWVGEQLSKSHN